MLNKARERIKTQQKEKKDNRLVYLIGELLLDVIGDNETTAEIIYQDLEKSEMSLHAVAKNFWDYARSHKKDNFYGMDDSTARMLISEFYGISAEEKRETETKKSKILSLEDFI